MKRIVRHALLTTAIIVVAAACSPAQMAAWLEHHDLEVPTDQAELEAQAEWATEVWAKWHAYHEELRRQAAAAAAAPAPAPSSGFGWPWDALVQCEASGNWHINTGNGYHGGLQFHPGTWNAYGGQAYAAFAHQATPSQQIDIARRVVAAAGGTYRDWPACRARLGLP